MQPDESIAFLLEGHLLDARDLVQGEVRVEDRSARHRSFAVHCTTRPGIFLKIAPSGDVLGTLAAEATFYRLVNSASRLAVLQPFVPHMLTYDAERQLLALELVAKGSNARNGAGGPGALAEIGSQLGHLLALCHSAGTSDDPDTRSAFSEMLPWAFRVALPEPSLFRDVGPLQLDLIRLVQRHPEIVDRFREVRGAWQWSAFTHGDIRWTNVLIGESAGLRLVDWEAAGIGDPAWDVASAFEGWLSRGLETLPLDVSDGPAEASARFAQTLPALQRQMSALWNSYASTAALSGQSLEELRDRATAYTGIRLLQSAYEWASGRTALSPFILLTVQLAVSLLRQRAEARAAVLGVGTA
jgi:aminoglycoside phosphotransferase (APT) family kinase protein